MNKLYPVYTLQNECQDCYKCIRHCPVKAIKIQGGHASVIPERCIACGKCVVTCPQNAKKVRSDINSFKNSIKQGKKVVISIAPSWPGFFNTTSSQIISAIKQLGAYSVSETALGAQEVSIETTRQLSNATPGIYLSSACPAIVDFIRTYIPEYTKNIMKVASPALTHAKMLKRHYEEDIEVFFIGPCIAKKNESEKHPDIITSALTFNELKALFDEKGIKPEEIQDAKEETFIPERAHEGALYPLEGGMNETLKNCGVPENVQLVSISSIKSFKKALEGLNTKEINQPVFIEALACEGGCINGPNSSINNSSIFKTTKILSEIKKRKNIPEKPSTIFIEDYTPSPVEENPHSIEAIHTAMQSIGKNSVQDELNCGGCGYDTCRQLVNALLSGDAEPSMCTSYMKQIATKKALAMLRFMPSGIVMVDSNLNIIETNEVFLKMFSPELHESFKNRIESIAGASLEKIIPFIDIFKSALRSGKEIHKERYPVNDRLYDITLFTIEENQIVGAVITDVTQTEMRRDQIAKKAQAVITKNIEIVQEIACKLGEHMVDTELLLSSIAEGYDTTGE